MAAEGNVWGAERIRGELPKLGISVAKRPVQQYMSKVRSVPPDCAPRWSAFLRQEATGIWASDYRKTRDL